MANDTPGSDARSVARDDETTFSARPDLPPPGNPADPDATALDTARPGRSGSSAGAPDGQGPQAADGRGSDAAPRRDDGRYDVPQATSRPGTPGSPAPAGRGPAQDGAEWGGARPAGRSDTASWGSGSSGGSGPAAEQGGAPQTGGERGAAPSGDGQGGGDRSGGDRSGGDRSGSAWSGSARSGGIQGGERGSVQGTGGYGAVRPGGYGPSQGAGQGGSEYGARPGAAQDGSGYGAGPGSAQGGSGYGAGPGATQGGSGYGAGPSAAQDGSGYGAGQGVAQGGSAYGAGQGGYGSYGAAQAGGAQAGPGSYSTGGWGSGSYGGGQGGEPARGGTSVYGPGGTGQLPAVGRGGPSTGQQPAVGLGGPSTGQQPAVSRGGPSTGQQPAVGWAPAPAAKQRRGPGWAALLVVGLVAALLGGAAGAFGAGLLDGVGAGGSGGSAGVLGAPVPDVADASAPIGPVEAVAERVLPSVVQLRVEGQGSAGEGSGIVLSADGLILTNNHVVEAASAGGSVTVVFQDGQTAPAQIVGLDPTSDLAVIRAQGRTDLTPADLGNSDAVRVGQQVVAFGSPLGLGGTVTTGIISAVDRAVSVGEESGASEATVLNALQTDAAINPGNSGGPLTDMDGRIIGINSVIATTGQQGGSIGVGFAIPVNQARRIATELEATGSATRAVLGVSLAPDDERSLTGAVVQAVTPGGAAEAAGIVAGDVIVRFGDQRVTNGTELQAAVRSHTPGEVVEVQLVNRTIQVTPTGESG